MRKVTTYTSNKTDWLEPSADISKTGRFLHKTQCQDEVRILSGRTQKLKVAKLKVAGVGNS